MLLYVLYTMLQHTVTKKIHAFSIILIKEPCHLFVRSFGVDCISLCSLSACRGARGQVYGNQCQVWTERGVGKYQLLGKMTII